MLILTRRVGEAVIVGDNIVVRVVGVKGNQVRIAFNAPKDTRIDREEVRVRVDAGEPHPTRNAEAHRPTITLKSRRRVESDTA